MYGSNEDNEVVRDLEDRYAQHNATEGNIGAATGKKKKKRSKRPVVKIDPSGSASMQPDI